MVPKIKDVVNLGFVIDDFNVNVSPDTHVYTPWHAHDFYELVLVVEGFGFHHIQDTVSLVMEGDIFLIKPGVCHQYSGAKDFKIINLLFEKDALFGGFMEELLMLPRMYRFNPDIPDVFPQIHLEITQRESLQRWLAQIKKEYDEKNTGWQLKIRTFLQNVLVEYAMCFSSYKQQHSAENRHSSPVRNAVQYVADHYAEDLTVLELANLIGVTPDYLTRQFQKMIGVGVHDYIQRYRISRSLKYLQDGYSVSETAKKCGFNDSSYFGRVFKNEVGIPPTHYKQHIKEKTSVISMRAMP